MLQYIINIEKNGLNNFYIYNRFLKGLLNIQNKNKNLNTHIAKTFQNIIIIIITAFKAISIIITAIEGKIITLTILY